METYGLSRRFVVFLAIFGAVLLWVLSRDWAPEMRANERIDVLLDVGQDMTSVSIVNKTKWSVRVLDSLMFDNPHIPPAMAFKIADVSDGVPGDLSQYDDELDWMIARNHPGEAFLMDARGIKIAANAQMTRSLSTSFILGDEAHCEKQMCQFLVKFRADAYVLSDIDDVVSTQSPWFIYKVGSPAK